MSRILNEFYEIVCGDCGYIVSDEKKCKGCDANIYMSEKDEVYGYLQRLFETMEDDNNIKINQGILHIERLFPDIPDEQIKKYVLHYLWCQI